MYAKQGDSSNGGDAGSGLDSIINLIIPLIGSASVSNYLDINTENPKSLSMFCFFFFSFFCQNL